MDSGASRPVSSNNSRRAAAAKVSPDAAPPFGTPILVIAVRARNFATLVLISEERGRLAPRFPSANYPQVWRLGLLRIAIGCRFRLTGLRVDQTPHRRVANDDLRLVGSDRDIE